MKVQVNWQNTERTVLLYQFEQGWDWEDMHGAFQEAREKLAMVKHQVHIIMDLSHANLIPSGALAKIRWAFTAPKQENVGLTVVITPSSFLKTMIDMGTKLWGNAAKNWKVAFVTSQEEAHGLLDQYRAGEVRND